ncbi:hypothetical protein AUTU_07110 [Aureibacter tunicatorum]|nr:hypothetical protein AUTU_07110 [Aureibacter tunicatorum]
MDPSTKGKMRVKYEISNLGRIRSMRGTAEPYVLQLGKISGYFVFNMIIKITEDNKRIKQNKYLHRLIAEYFCENYTPDCVVIHLDHNKLNNDARNLACVSHKEAIAHRKTLLEPVEQKYVWNGAIDEDFDDNTLRRVTTEEEVFKTIEGFKKYEVSNKGRIRKKPSKDSIGRRGRGNNMEMKQRIHPKENFYFLDLIDDFGKRKTVYPHKEVAKAFCINVLNSERIVVVHIDGNTLNNDSTNLEWATYSEAIKLQFKQGKKNNFKVWEKRKQLYKNGFKPKEQQKLVEESANNE